VAPWSACVDRQEVARCGVCDGEVSGEYRHNLHRPDPLTADCVCGNTDCGKVRAPVRKVDRELQAFTVKRAGPSPRSSGSSGALLAETEWEDAVAAGPPTADKSLAADWGKSPNSMVGRRLALLTAATDGQRLVLAPAADAGPLVRVVP
jgi:hypothetical protein